mgnify:CR=1 FL=1
MHSFKYFHYLIIYFFVKQALWQRSVSVHTVAKDRYNRLIYCGSSMWFYIHTYRIARRNIHTADKVKNNNTTYLVKWKFPDGRNAVMYKRISTRRGKALDYTLTFYTYKPRGINMYKPSIFSRHLVLKSLYNYSNFDKSKHVVFHLQALWRYTWLVLKVRTGLSFLVP